MVRESASVAYDMAGREEKFLRKDMFTPYEITAKNQLPRRPFLKKRTANVSGPHS